MISKSKDIFLKLKQSILNEKRAASEIDTLFRNMQEIGDKGEKRRIFIQIDLLKKSIKNENENIKAIVKGLSLVKPLPSESREDLVSGVIEKNKIRKEHVKGKDVRDIRKSVKLEELEKEILKRVKVGEKKVSEKKERRPSFYLRSSSKLFSDYSRSLIQKGLFRKVKKDLVMANLRIAPTSYVSMILFSTMLAGIVSFFLFLFLLFFNISSIAPFVSLASGEMGIRILRYFWILILGPLATFFMVYIYPSLEKSTNEIGINRELPFATIHMASISGSLIEPTKIFSIIISTKEYPYLEKEFRKIINEINIYGYDLVTALKNAAARSSSKKLIELYNGLSTTITSGGSLSDFFNKRAETLLLEHRLEREKYTKATETFMDIYISVVIAAPMILMLLLMMMQISGLGVSLSPSLISLIMILGIAIINIFFLVFLHLKQPTE